MFVCVCNAVTDREVDEAIDAGAHTREAVTKACGAGGDCGACHAMIEARIAEKTGQALLPCASLVRGRAA